MDSTPPGTSSLGATGKAAFTVGPFQRIYDPSLSETEKWYINDHNFIQDEQGQWHLFGITQSEPIPPMLHWHKPEYFFAHATAPDLLGPWTKQEHVLYAAPDEPHVWAPYLLRHEGLYYMYYCGGGVDNAHYRIQLATSKDLWHWERHPANPMIVDGFDARDPMVLRLGDKWVMYYTATSEPTGGHWVVKAATSSDLVHWSEGKEVFRSEGIGTSGGPTESPQLVVRNGKYYLFMCTNTGYNETTAYESDSPFHWGLEDEIGKYPAHASEIIELPDGRWFVSRCGWGEGGLYLAEMTWER